MADQVILVVCGLNREVRVAEGPGVVAIAGGADSTGLQRLLAGLRPSDVAAVVSFGLAGALSPALKVGDFVVPEEVLDEAGQRWRTDLDISARLKGAAAGLGARPGPKRAFAVLGVNAPVLDVAAKARLGGETGAVAVDMESHIAAAYAARVDVPFSAIRIVSDGADRALPPAAAIAMRPDGSIDLPGVLRSLYRQPGQIPALITTARDAGIAFRKLRRVRGLLGPRFGLHL